MRLRRFVLVGINLALLAAFWPLADELLSVDVSDPVAYRPSSHLPPAFIPWPEQPDLERPLFRNGPPPSEHDDPPPTVDSRPTIRLLGITLTNERRVAMIEINGLTLRIEEGGDVNGWQVTQIEPRKIRLENSEQHVDVLLDPPADTR